MIRKVFAIVLFTMLLAGNSSAQINTTLYFAKNNLEQDWMTAIESFYVSKLAARRIVELGNSVSHPSLENQKKLNEDFLNLAIQNYASVQKSSLRDIKNDLIVLAQMQGIQTAKNWDAEIEKQWAAEKVETDSYDAYLIASKVLLDIRYLHIQNGLRAIKRIKEKNSPSSTVANRPSEQYQQLIAQH